MENSQQHAQAETPTSNFFTGSIPRNYDTYMGPVLLNPYAIDLAGRIKQHGKIEVLELAAGTGIVTRYLLQALPNADIAATDISEDMMNIAKETIASPKLYWANLDMAAIPFANDSFDLIVCQFGLMFVPDKQKALSEMHRVLKPGGQLLFNTWGNIAENPMWQISFGLFKQVFGEMPVPMQQSPFALTDLEEIKQLLTEANFTTTKVEEVRKTTQVETAKSAAQRFLLTAPTLAQKPEYYPDLLSQLEKRLAENLGDNPLVAPMMALVFEATKAGN